MIYFLRVMEMEKNINKFTAMFEQSIGVAEPWYVTGAEFKENEQEVHIYIGIRDGGQLPCPECGDMCYRYGYEEKERVWRHVDCLLYPAYVHCQRPRIKCEKHGVRVAGAPWARKNSRFTLLFEGYAMLILADMPILKASAILRCNEKSLVTMMRHWIDKALRQDDLCKVTALGIDETSFKKKQSYVTVILDAMARRVIDVEQGRGSDTVVKFSYKLEERGGDCNRIEQVSSDMSKAYMSGIAECFPNAKLTIDKFHIKKLLLDAMDEVRQAEQRQNKSRELNNSRKLLMIPWEKMNPDQLSRVRNLSKLYPNTGRAFRMVSVLDAFYRSSDLTQAQAILDRLISWMRRSRLEPMKRAAETLKKYFTEILNYFVTRLTNAICEGINSMIQAAKRKARGYKTIDGYMYIIYLIAAKLTLACPNPLKT